MHIVVRYGQVKVQFPGHQVCAGAQRGAGQAALMKCEMLAACIAAVLASCSSPRRARKPVARAFAHPVGAVGFAEISVETARDLGFRWTVISFLFGGGPPVTFHRSDQGCADAGGQSAQGSIVFWAELQSLSNMKSNPKCMLGYRAIVTLETDDGSFSSGRFEAQGVSQGADFPTDLVADVDARRFGGWRHTSCCSAYDPIEIGNADRHQRQMGSGHRCEPRSWTTDCVWVSRARVATSSFTAETAHTPRSSRRSSR